MKAPTRVLIPIAILCGNPSNVRGATINAFWSAQTEQDAIANGGSFNPNPTASTFPTLVSIAVSGASAGGQMAGGAPSFTDFQGNSWNGVANATGAGFAFGWNGTSVVGTDALTLSLDLSNIQNLLIRMDVRSAQGGSNPPRASAFEAIEYSYAGGSFTAVPGANLGNFTTNNYTPMSFDLSAISAIEGQSNVQIRFTVADTQSTTSFRMDNIQLTAETVPEPTAAAVLAVGCALSAFRRKRS